MIDPLQDTFKVAASGLEAQSTRMRVATENIANADSTGTTPGANPYARKLVTFASELDEASGAALVQVKGIATDASNFRIEHDPGHPAADANGNVKYPNVNVIMEMADIREANRSYEANLQVFKQARDLVSMTINLLSNP
jgi:flagellar basal-body rod protein FlgC